MKAKRFGRQLNEAAKLIAHHEHMTMSGLFLRLAEELYVSPHTLNNWRYGRRLPSSDEDVRALAEALFKYTAFDRKHFDRAWFRTFLEAADFADVESFLDIHFPEPAQPVQADPTDLLPPPPPEPVPQPSEFVGREAELSAYRQHLLDRHLLVITGMAGVGKTALAAKLVSEAPFATSPVFWHTFRQDDEVETILWLLAAFLAHHGRPAIWRLLQQDRRPPTGVVLRAILQQLTQIRAILCFDDFHHVDQNAFDEHLFQPLLGYLGPSLRLILISRYTPKHFTVSIPPSLEGLDKNAIRQLLALRGVQPSPEELDFLYQTSQGNPQLVLLSLTILQQGGAISARDAFWSTEPIIRYLLLEIYQGLSETERAVMRITALLDDALCTREAIEGILDQGSQLETLVSLIEKNLLSVYKSPRETTYRPHELVRRFFYELMSEQERRHYYLRAARFFESQGDALTVAYLYTQAGRWEDALQWLPERPYIYVGRGKAAWLSLIAEQLREEMEAREGQSHGEAYFRLVKILGALYRYRGEVAKALQIAQSAYEQAPDDAVRADMNMEIGLAHEFMGAYRQAEDCYERALRYYESAGDIRGMIDALRGMGWIAYRLGEVEAAIAYHRRSLALVEAMGDETLLARAQFSLGTALMSAGPDAWAEAKQRLAASRDIFHRVGNRLTEAKAIGNLGYIAGLEGDEETQLALYQEAIAMMEAIGDAKSLQIGYHKLAMLYLIRGEVAQARHYAQALQQVTEMTDLAPHRSIAQADLAHIALAEGDMAQAQAHAQQALEIAESLDEGIALGIALRAVAAVKARTGDEDAAREAWARSMAIFNAYHADDERAITERLLASVD